MGGGAAAAAHRHHNRSMLKTNRNSWSGQAAALALCMLLLCVLLLYHNAAPHVAPQQQQPSSNHLLSGQREVVGGTEVVWQLPTNGKPPKALLLAFHGCSHGAVDWWPKGPACPTCIGLPEEVSITRTALSRGFAVVAISSRDREHTRCWAASHEPHTQSVDTHAVVTVVRTLQQRPAFKGLPLFAVGASSGGAFALMLTPHLPLSAVCSQIMALPGAMYQPFLDAASPAAGAGQGWREPPVMFVHMTRDSHTAERVAESVALRRAKGLATQVVAVSPQPVTAQLLARVPELVGEPGQQLVDLFKQHGVIDRTSGLLLSNPRGAQWHAVVKSSHVPELQALNLTPDQSGLSQILNVAWAQHELVSDPTEQMLDWFELVVGAAER